MAIARLRAVMTKHAGVVRTAKGLRTALDELGTIEQDAGNDSVLANMVLTARLITAAALQRKESRGGHFRSDYPKSSNALAKRTFITLAALEALEGKTTPGPNAATLADCRT